MEKKYYILISIIFGWISYFIFPIEDPALTYFLGIFIGSISLFYIPNKKYTHNVWFQVCLWTVILLIFPYYIFAGLAVGVGTHIGLDAVRRKIKIGNLKLHQQWLFIMTLLFINSLLVTVIAIEKMMSY